MSREEQIEEIAENEVRKERDYDTKLRESNDVLEILLSYIPRSVGYKVRQNALKKYRKNSKARQAAEEKLKNELRGEADLSKMREMVSGNGDFSKKDLRRLSTYLTRSGRRLSELDMNNLFDKLNSSKIGGRRRGVIYTLESLMKEVGAWKFSIDMDETLPDIIEGDSEELNSPVNSPDKCDRNNDYAGTVKRRRSTFKDFKVKLPSQNRSPMIHTASSNKGYGIEDSDEFVNLDGFSDSNSDEFSDSDDGLDIDDEKNELRPFIDLDDVEDIDEDAKVVVKRQLLKVKEIFLSEDVTWDAVKGIGLFTSHVSPSPSPMKKVSSPQSGTAIFEEIKIDLSELSCIGHAAKSVSPEKYTTSSNSSENNENKIEKSLLYGGFTDGFEMMSRELWLCDIDPINNVEMKRMRHLTANSNDNGNRSALNISAHTILPREHSKMQIKLVQPNKPHVHKPSSNVKLLNGTR